MDKGTGLTELESTALSVLRAAVRREAGWVEVAQGLITMLEERKYRDAYERAARFPNDWPYADEEE